LRIAKTLPLAETLRKEIDTFTVKISSSGHESYEAWREQDHDDLVLALALALWSTRRTERPWGVSGPVKLTRGMGEEEPVRRQGALGYGAEGQDWLDW
jgi:hypothetical protein